MDIDNLIQNYKSFDELKIFVQAQFKQIQTLTKKNKDLQEKVDKAAKETKQIIKAEATLLPADFKILDDAKTISQIQLNLLKEQSFERELTTDEAKRVEIYNRILKEEEPKEKPLKANVELIKDAELLQLVDNG